LLALMVSARHWNFCTAAWEIRIDVHHLSFPAVANPIDLPSGDQK